MNCKNCIHYRSIRRWTYTDEGVQYECPEGFACVAMAELNEPVIHMIGTTSGCEMFEDIGVIEGRRQMLQEVKELLEKLKNDSKRVFKTG